MSSPTVMVRSHPTCCAHTPGLGHPESARRVQVILDALEAGAAGRWSVDRTSPLPPEKDVIGILKWIHDPAYIDRVRTAASRGNGWLDTQDCRVSAGTWDAAVAAAGLALNAALDLVNNKLQRAFLVLRPPSHHAEREAAKGYCFFNSVAVAAEVVAQSLDKPVLIVDFDAHHGNGTQRHFYDRGDVGYVSVHGFPTFPGTGTADETGAGEGEGLTRNVPLALDSDDATFCAAFEHAVDEVGSRLRPSAIVVSAGFDGHASDPVGGLRLSEDGFRRLSAVTLAAAERWAQGRVLSLLEGGFELQAVANIARIHVEELAGADITKADA